jgi:ABC-type transport system involved in cytochrome bd biosynthesis fused ATPase/permease subunit
MALPGSATTTDFARLARRLGWPGPSRGAGLWPAVGRRPARRLSTGERKRLLLDVLLMESGPLLLDEPFEHLSPDAKETLSNGLRNRARGHVVVVATNQGTWRAGREGGVRIEAGLAAPLAGASTEERGVGEGRHGSVGPG